MEKQEQLDALKDLSSMLISLLSVIGIILTLIVYFIVSPSISSLKDNSNKIFSSVVKISDSISENNKAVNYAIETQKQVLSGMKSSLNSSVQAVRSTKESLLKIQSLTGYDFTNESIQLKESEDEMTQLLAQIELTESKMSETYIATQEKSNLSQEILKASNEFSLSLSSLDILFTGTTLILIILFLCMILLSAEDLLI